MTAVPDTPTRICELTARTAAFIRDHVLPLESEAVAGGRAVDDTLRAELATEARAVGVFAPLSPVEHGGLALDYRSQAPVLEAAGASLLGPAALHCNAPDDGNIHLLADFGTPEQDEQYLAPLATGAVRSSLAMSEPAPGAGSDPQMLTTLAEPVVGGWLINGAKHFVTGADGAAFVICAARTAGGVTLFLVDAENPGMRLGHRMPTLDHCVPGGHSTMAFENCFVPDSAVLGEVDRGLHLIQARMAPSRLQFCMRWLGLAARAHQMSAQHINHRTSFGVPVAEHGLAQGLVADNEIDITAARALIHGTAALMDQRGPADSESRHAASVTKTFVSEAVWRVLDRAVQLYGGLGVCEDALVARFLVEARGFRIYEGPSEVLRGSIARRVLRRFH